MDNIEKLVKKHKNNFLRKNDTNKRSCNCRANNACPLDGKCSSSNIFYSAGNISLLATINTETNTLVSAKQNSKPI